MIDITPFVAKYVRLLHETLDNVEVPYSQTQFGVVLMVDVAGFSTLMTTAEKNGQSGAEAVALAIGSYFGECIQIVEFYGGDVVKFLGDALLVCFQGDSSDPFDTESVATSENIGHTSQRQKNLLVRRATECGKQLLARLSHYRVYLTAEEQARHCSTGDSVPNDISDAMRIPEEIRNQIEQQNLTNPDLQSTGIKNIDYFDNQSHFISPTCLNWLPCVNFGLKKARQRQLSIMSDTSHHETNAVYLELHLALSCGDITNAILGDNNPEGKDDLRWRFPTQYYGEKTDGKQPDVSRHYYGRLEYAIGGHALESLDKALSAAKAGEMSITPEAYEYIKQQQMDQFILEKRNEFHIFKNPEIPDVVSQPLGRSRSFLSLIHTDPIARYLEDKPVLKNQASNLNIEPLVPRVRNTTYMQLSSDNAQCLKYVNQSAIYRLEHSRDANYPAQFRDVTIMFVSIGKADLSSQKGLEMAQSAVYTAIQILHRHEGLLQQFAIDDKGATLLAVFGLPPFSHEGEAIFAAKAAVELRSSYMNLQLPVFSIALSSGTIFTAVLPAGNPFRRDPAIFGDTIILAVRMLQFPFSKKNIICDSATKARIGGLCDFVDLGENFVKGKAKPVQLYSIRRFGVSLASRQIPYGTSNVNFLGYESHLKRAIDFVNSWMTAQNHHLMIVSGPSGVGKTYFCQELADSISLQGVSCCWTSATEVDKYSRFYLLRNLLATTLNFIDSDRVPYKRETRSPTPGQVSIPPNQLPSATNEAVFHSIGNRTEFIQQLSRPLSPGSLIPRRTSSSDTNGLGDLISRCLEKCGEDKSLMPLFKCIFPVLYNVQEYRSTDHMDDRACDILLINAIVHLLEHASKYISLVLICDNIQWADSASAYVLSKIHEVCQKVFLILVTRPQEDYDASLINEMNHIGSFEVFSLNGLTLDEISKVIIQFFPDEVKKVSKTIVKTVQKRTRGYPFYVRNMAQVMKDSNHVTVFRGELIPSSSTFDLDDYLENCSYDRSINLQFDRLDDNFQEVLSAAACLDTGFNIYDVKAVISDTNTIFADMTLDGINKAIQRYDAYHLLKQVRKTSHSSNDSDTHMFSNASIPYIIYETMSFRTRAQLHLAYAQYYESRLSHNNYCDLLPKVTKQYLLTDCVHKQLYYLDALATLNIRSYLLTEATANLEHIVKILDENDDLKLQFDWTQRSDVFRRLGVCYTMRSNFALGERYLHRSLDCLNKSWPTSDAKLSIGLYFLRFVVARHRILRKWTKYRSDLKNEVGWRTADIMMHLSNIYYYRGCDQNFVYATLFGLYECHKLSNRNNRLYAFFLSRTALIYWLSDKRELSVSYVCRALECMGEEIMPPVLIICAQLCFSSGRFSDACRLLYKATSATRALGIVAECTYFYRAVRMIITMRIFQGRLDSSPIDQNLMKQLADTAHRNGDHEAEVWMAIYQVSNYLVMAHMGEVDQFVALLETQSKNAAHYNRIAIHGTLMYYYARNGSFSSFRRHAHRFVQTLPHLSRTPNILPIFGLIFGTMAYYCIAKHRPIEYFNTVSSNYLAFTQDINHLNHAFQNVKFWEFTQPCLYLARALPYISTGRIVEGYKVLYQGVTEMHFMDEIYFLKAYYWSCLGKWAYTPEDRDAWTRLARQDFENLKIPSDIYCGPDLTKPILNRMLDNSRS